MSSSVCEADSAMAAVAIGVDLERGPCSAFQPQQWRSAKCKVCFHDESKHTSVVDETTTKASVNKDIAGECPSGESDKDMANIRGESVIDLQGDMENARMLAAYVDEEKDSQDEREHIDYCDDECENCSGEDEEAQTNAPHNNNRPKSVIHRSPKSLKSSRKDVVRLGAFDWSSNSSVASVDTFASDDAGNLSETSMVDDEDEDLAAKRKSMVKRWSSSCQPEEKFLVAGDYSLDKIFDLQREIENLKDSNRILRLSQDRETQGFEKEIGNLRLELANFTARENLTILKNRLELEGKSLRIEDLENETKHFRCEIDRLTTLSGNPEDEKHAISRELDRKIKRIISLEEENKTLEDSLRLAEDLQNNDRELLNVLRNQVEAVEHDHKSSLEKNKLLEEKLRHVTETQSALEHERERSSQLARRVESLNEKLRHRERHIGDLEDDNVKLQLMKNELESRLMKENNAHQRQDANISDLKLTIDQSDCELERLSQENKRLKDLRRTNKSSSVLQSYVVELEDRLDQAEVRNRHLEEANATAVKETKAVLHRLHVAEKNCKELKQELKATELTVAELEQLDKDNDKQLLALRKKLQKAEKQKKKAVHEILEMDRKLAEVREKYEEASCHFDDAEKDIWMMRRQMQSAEAKLAVMQNDKLYLESKLDSIVSYDAPSHVVETDEATVDSGIGCTATASHVADVSGAVSPDAARVSPAPCRSQAHGDISNTREMLQDNLLQLGEQDILLNAKAGQLYSMSSVVSSLEKQLETTRHMLTSKSSENVELREVVAQMQADSERFEMEKDELLAKMEEIVMDNEELQRNVNSLRCEVYGLEHESENVAGQPMESLSSEKSVDSILEELLSQVESKDQRINNLEELIFRKESTISDLTAQIRSFHLDNDKHHGVVNCINTSVSPDRPIPCDVEMPCESQTVGAYSNQASYSDDQDRYLSMEEDVSAERTNSMCEDTASANEVSPGPATLNCCLVGGDTFVVGQDATGSTAFQMPQFVQGQRICINVPLPLTTDSSDDEASSAITCMPDMRLECNVDADDMISNVTVRSLHNQIQVDQQPNNVVHVTILKDGSVEQQQRVGPS